MVSGGREHKMLMKNLPLLAELSLDELEIEANRLMSHQVDLLSRGTCRYRVCSGAPHDGFPWWHEAKHPAEASPFAEGQMLDAGYRSRPHLDYLSRRLVKAVADVEHGKSRWLTVSMPPRSGKSQMISVYLPIWLLHKHSDWKIGLISHSPSLATAWGRQVRREVEEHGSELGIEVASDAGAISEWQTVDGGSVTSRSAPGQTITGLGFKVLVVDDPVKDFAAAHSQNARDALWDWWTANTVSRLEPPSLVIVVGCLTAESPVLMANGTETRIADLEPGDMVVTYQNGEWTTAPVTRWANVGADRIYTLRMASGRVVRGNAKHPFLVRDTEGVERWARMDSLKPGDRIVAMSSTVTGKASSARSTDATHPSVLEDCASTTTMPPGGPWDTGATLPSRTGGLISGTGTASTPRTTRSYLRSRVAYAESAGGVLLPRTLTEKVSSSPITITSPDEYGDCCATTATSSSGTELPPSYLRSLPPTCDLVESIELGDYEDVYDIEVAGTHSFVVNGLATHNTRWHEDDLIGRLLSSDYQGSPDLWERIEFPAIAETDDVLGRTPGQPLYSPLLDESEGEAVERWAEVRETVGSYSWASLYQQHPAPATGEIFDSDWWRFWTTNPASATEDGRVVYLDPEDTRYGANGGTPRTDEHESTRVETGRWLDSWDCTFKGTDSSDYVVGQRWLRRGPYRYLIAQTRGRWSFTETLERMDRWCSPESAYGEHVHERLVEEAANGAAVIDVMRQKISGLVPVNPRDPKDVRARAVTPEVESHHVLLPYPGDAGNEWVGDLLDEFRNFPHGAHDDQVDSATQALSRLRDRGKASITAPAVRMGMEPRARIIGPRARTTPSRFPRRVG